MSEFKHLPADLQAALDQYDADVADGTIRFDDSGFASEFPGKAAADKSLRDHVAAHVRFLCAAALVAASALIAGCGAQQAASCLSPARQGATWSSYRTAGTMRSGSTVRLSDGDLWTCTNGRVSVH